MHLLLGIFTCIATFAALDFFRNDISNEKPAQAGLAKFLTREAYGVYLVHAYVCVLLTIAYTMVVEATTGVEVRFRCGSTSATILGNDGEFILSSKVHLGLALLHHPSTRYYMGWFRRCHISLLGTFVDDCQRNAVNHGACRYQGCPLMLSLFSTTCRPFPSFAHEATT